MLKTCVEWFGSKIKKIEFLIFQIFGIFPDFLRFFENCADLETQRATFLAQTSRCIFLAPEPLELPESSSRHRNMFILLLGTQHSTKGRRKGRKRDQIRQNVEPASFSTLTARNCARFLWRHP